MTREIHLIRHGQSTFNAHMSETGEDPIHVDAALSPLGHEQVAHLARELKRVDFDVVVTTPYTRAIQTSLGLFGGREIPILVEALHREYAAASCDIGRSPGVLAEAFPALDFGHLDDPWWYVDSAAGTDIATEPGHLLLERVRRFRVWLDQRPERRIVVVGHGMFFYELVGRFLANCEVAVLGDG